MILGAGFKNNCQGFNKCIKKEKDEINVLVYMEKWRALVGVKQKILPVAEVTK